ncbi:MAG: hypothetical protein O9284_09380 [Steroidobacteraceae bacterium]|nr:hypothetical protein [Steroidobacteraceae bacterium]
MSWRGLNLGPRVDGGPFPATVGVNAAQESTLLADVKESRAERNARETRESRLLALRSAAERYRRHGLGDDPEVARLEAEIAALLETRP